MELCGRDPACLVARVDRTGADFSLHDTGPRRDAGHVEGDARWPVHRTASADWSERHFRLKVENTWEHTAGEIARALETAFEETGADPAVLAGDPRERQAVHARLPEAVRAVTVTSDHGGRAPGSDSVPLERDVDRARREHLSRRTEEALDGFRAGRVGTDRPTDAVEGVPALVEAAREHRIGTLLLRPGGSDLHREVRVGATPDRIAERRTDAQYLGESEPVSARADGALLRSAAATAADVLVLPPADAEDADTEELPVGGLGALLRWSYEQP
ncbi:hypothetical protein GCM10010405_31720 [Streptomyces macrosporus]|uniref:Uncharacterized protein n=1 Tax=Streptomyces macrosporus TaxID=44032 RepID=A0ABP5X662_9ACTN